MQLNFDRRSPERPSSLQKGQRNVHLRTAPELNGESFKVCLVPDGFSTRYVYGAMLSVAHDQRHVIPIQRHGHELIDIPRFRAQILFHRLSALFLSRRFV